MAREEVEGRLTLNWRLDPVRLTHALGLDGPSFYRLQPGPRALALLAAGCWLLAAGCWLLGQVEPCERAVSGVEAVLGLPRAPRLSGAKGEAGGKGGHDPALSPYLPLSSLTLVACIVTCEHA